MLSLTSCNLGNYYVSALDLTATAVFATALDDATTTFYATQSPPPIAEPTPIPLVPTPDIEIPTPTELSIPILESDPLPTATRDNEETTPHPVL